MEDYNVNLELVNCDVLDSFAHNFIDNEHNVKVLELLIDHGIKIDDEFIKYCVLTDKKTFYRIFDRQN